MTEKQYEKISAPFRKNDKVIRYFNLANTILTILVYIAYPSLLLYLLLCERQLLIRSVFVPAVMLVVVSALRKIINRPRPYEKLNIEPIIKKDKKGESMPSRHLFSAFVIAMTFLYVNPLWSIPLFVIGALLCFLRVVGGVHYLSDVLVGAGIGIVSGLIGFFII